MKEELEIGNTVLVLSIHPELAKECTILKVVELPEDELVIDYRTREHEFPTYKVGYTLSDQEPNDVFPARLLKKLKD